MCFQIVANRDFYFLIKESFCLFIIGISFKISLWSLISKIQQLKLIIEAWGLNSNERNTSLKPSLKTSYSVGVATNLKKVYSSLDIGSSEEMTYTV